LPLLNFQPSYIKNRRGAESPLLVSSIILRHTTSGKNPQEERSARRRDLYLTTHIIHKSQTSMSSAGVETTIPPHERLYTQALDREATGFDSSFTST